MVKLGGSLSETGELKRWLALIARASRPVIVVPGGGAFADAVRRAQAETRFSDAAAHRMAILAMHQTGLMLIAMQPRLIGVETRAQMRAALHAGRIAVWLPLRMCDRDELDPCRIGRSRPMALRRNSRGDAESLRGMSDQVALLRLHHVHRSSRTGRHRRSAIRGHRHTRWAYLARHWPRRGAQAGRCAGHRRSQSQRCRKACATPPARGRSTRPPHHAIARTPWHKLRSERRLSTRRSNRGVPAMAENLLFLTGKLAEDRLTEMVQCLDFPAGSWRSPTSTSKSPR